MEISLNSLLTALAVVLISVYFFNTTALPVLFSKVQAVPRRRSSNLHRIVITGGPCGGKTTAMSLLSKKLGKLNYKVYIVPEAATLLMKGGAMLNLIGLDDSVQTEFQANLMRMQMVLEDTFTEVASYAEEENTVIICDRGLMDGSAYISTELWQILLDEQGWTAVHLRDRRYEAVIHMVTAARGAAEHYTLSSNEARYEGLRQAEEIDVKLQNSWIGHASFAIIANTAGSFEEKLEKCYNQVLKYIGHAVHDSSSRKYLVRREGAACGLELPKSVLCVRVRTEETFLLGDEDSLKIESIQKRGHSGSYTYRYKVKDFSPDEACSVVKCQITALEYMQFVSRKNARKRVIHKLSQYFVHENAYFRLDTFLNVADGVTLLKVSDGQVKLPQGIEVLRDVKSEKEYSSFALATTHWYGAPDQDSNVAMQDLSGN